jgi:hypothetical protein
MISVIGTPRIQSNIERIMVSFMSYKLPYEFLTSCPVKRRPASENARWLPQKSAIKPILASHLNPRPVHLLVDALAPLIASQGETG